MARLEPHQKCWEALAPAQVARPRLGSDPVGTRDGEAYSYKRKASKSDMLLLSHGYIVCTILNSPFSQIV